MTSTAQATRRQLLQMARAEQDPLNRELLLATVVHLDLEAESRGAPSAHDAMAELEDSVRARLADITLCTEGVRIVGGER